ncbi:hypothetical protein AUEXF2481DRAFT_39938 [Aureobasidium subglaciale EXF-2481]|uniref:Calcium-dependent phosphotriesterase n=1 Tax=Aureobasidium subglaciale (strain EXF-2481) TaxID=1043005 RepID=A0A074YH26_AURSE|nr:uncharacterized protein AUEXF2481DRAFT_39938 [Aureobasidium subglaciale EXF-2481]KAI5204903.1 hypothetical protein E4T38_04503 [Aureobasidium subglaciale]KAI5223907.1 hypothetical protein E4T40_04279 [Aureobasidium subglaciale]KAI5227370.1 hypothetical protein E4T41_04361 [Aureobasidium subglaciale]KAI5262692.1 hypothetical protein E4T46_04247 [Aureobasidium subglaciale]KEQ95384.1 hypothetical protein AUEXF2481DRAFT_39938 [Aureobasidium subglaciale EXF-2481]
MGLKLNIFLLLIAACIPHIYSRLSLLYNLESSNHPSKLSTPRGWFTEQGSYEVKYADKLRNCEDLVVDEKAGYVVLSCDESRDGWNTVMGIFTTPPTKNGALYLYDYSRPTPSLESIRLLSTPEDYSFHPLGLSLNLATNTLIAVNHATSGSRLDLFHFSRLGNSATFIRSISSPYLRAPNAAVQISDTSVLVTNDHFFTPRSNGFMNKLETYLGLPFGGITHVDLQTGAATQLSRLAYANGIAILNETTLAVASSSLAKIFFYSIDKSTFPPTLKHTEAISTPFYPDNLHTSGDKLFIAGHAHLSSLQKFAKQRARCASDVTTAGCNAEAATYVAQWTEQAGLQEVYVGKEIYSSSGVGVDEKRGVGVIGGLYGKGLLIWNKERK